KMPRGDKKAIQRFRIPIPPLLIQHEIVSILDKFHSLTSFLTDGLPAELAARRKQYEYYRDKLLTFKEKING
ncbi:MAG TPA: restriction endonuclease subunit S, partial [Caldisericia bacterium]|nr:restriction endonuclease subunit S [Caldisericia bacterium]